MDNILKACFTALVTPMKSSGDIAYGQLSKLLDFQFKYASGVVLCGTTAEAPSLSLKEQEKIIELALTKNNNHKPLILGVSGNVTASVISAVKAASNYDVNALMVVAPYYNKPGQEGLYQHFMQIADNSKLPILLYNVPSRTGCDLLPETVIKLAAHSNIVGIKEATGDISRVKLLKDFCPSDFILFSGDDPSAGEFMLAGGDGVISVASNVIPKQMSQLCNYALAKNAFAVDKLNIKLKELFAALAFESNPIAIKWATSYLFNFSDGIRLPLTKLKEYNQQRLKAILNNLTKNTEELTEGLICKEL